MIRDQFEIAGGTVIGTDHAKAGKNNQDAFCWIASDNAIVAVVTDGCSDAPHSEVGAKIGARIIAETVSRRVENYNNSITALLPTPYPPYPFWENTYSEILSESGNIVTALGVNKKQIILDYFLFTVVGVLITPWTTIIFSIGDGMIFLNTESEKNGPYPNNAPPYLGYKLLPKTPTSMDPEMLQFKILRAIDTKDPDSILIGTDGVENLVSFAEKNMPGKSEKVGPISQFWQDDRYFKNPDMIRRKLALTNRTVTKIDWESGKAIKEHGLLPDDTTLVVIRRKK
ncbi:MAG: protein phosphatase 2C domain-containing protein [Patescibacteria group bacterium]